MNDKNTIQLFKFKYFLSTEPMRGSSSGKQVKYLLWNKWGYNPLSSQLEAMDISLE
jgi:hypothetical protein